MNIGKCKISTRESGETLSHFISVKGILFFLPLLRLDGWAKDDLIYQWKEKDPVQVVPNLHLPRFTLEQYKSAYCDVITNTGEWSGRKSPSSSFD